MANARWREIVSVIWRNDFGEKAKEKVGRKCAKLGIYSL